MEHHYRIRIFDVKDFYEILVLGALVTDGNDNYIFFVMGMMWKERENIVVL